MSDAAPTPEDAPQGPPPDAPPPPPQQQPQQPVGPEQFIANEAAFLQSIGINPNMVRKGTIEIEFIEGQPHVKFGGIIPVRPQDLGLAFLASAPAEPERQGPPPGAPPGPPMPADHLPPAGPPPLPTARPTKGGRRTAKKTAAKKVADQTVKKPPAKKAAAKKAPAAPEE